MGGTSDLSAKRTSENLNTLCISCFASQVFSTKTNEKNVGTTENRNYILDLLMHCRQIRPYVDYYKRQIKSYNNMVHHILIRKLI